MSLPPGPRLPGVLQTALYGMRPIEFVEACRKRYGDAFTLHVAPVGTLVFFCTPDAAKTIYKGDPDIQRSGEYSRSLLDQAMISEESRAYGGPRSVLFLDGAEHLHDRHLLMPLFEHSAVESYRDLIHKITLKEIEDLPRGRPFPLRDITYKIALSVMLQAVLGIPPSDRLQRLLKQIPRLLSFSPLLMAIPALRRGIGPISPAARFHRLRTEVEQLLTAEIETRRTHPTTNAHDAITRLLQAKKLNGQTLTTVEIRDELLMLATVGTETTASALAWSIERVLRSNTMLDRLRSELESDTNNLLDAVIKEALRTSPVLMGTGRRLGADCEIAGYQIPAGTMIRVAIPLIHSSPAVHDDARCFRPERFQGDRPPPPYTWIPFGGGVRRCLGANLALMELKVVLPTMLSRLDLRACGKQAEGARFRSVFLTPSKGTRVVYEGPRPSHHSLQPSTMEMAARPAKQSPHNCPAEPRGELSAAQTVSMPHSRYRWDGTPERLL